MKNPHAVAALWVFAFAAAAPVLRAEEPAQPARDAATMRDTGEKVAAALFGSLAGTLQEQIAKNGVVAAIPFCKAAALPMTLATAGTFEGVSSVRRVGVRTRNPANLPDPADLAVIQELLARWNPGAPDPTGVLREVPMSDGGSEWRYYKPIPVAATCLACHGGPDQIPQAVRDALVKSYPQDEAVNFSAGDLRGAVVVTFDKNPAATASPR